MKKKQFLDISVIIPVYNVEGILFEVLESLKMQDYPINEVIIIDNCSTDQSVKVAETFKRDNSNFPLKVIKREKTYGISFSYNLGAKMAKSAYIVTLHSDSALPTKNELRALVRPIEKDSTIVVTAPWMVLPKRVWLTYNFWQKCLFARDVDKEVSSGNGKFDCYNKEAFLKAGGYDEKRFSHLIGSEDADMYFRLRKIGKIVQSNARVIHLHGFDKEYSLSKWVARRQFLAITYGRYLQLHAQDLEKNILFFLIKPLLAMSIFLLFIHPLFIIPFIIFPFVYMPKMFTEASTVGDPRILLLPFVLIFLVFYETFWTLKSLFFRPLTL